MIKKIKKYFNERRKEKEFKKKMKIARKTIDKFDKETRKNEKKAH